MRVLKRFFFFFCVRCVRTVYRHQQFGSGTRTGLLTLMDGPTLRSSCQGFISSQLWNVMEDQCVSVTSGKARWWSPPHPPPQTHPNNPAVWSISETFTAEAWNLDISFFSVRHDGCFGDTYWLNRMSYCRDVPIKSLDRISNTDLGSFFFVVFLVHHVWIKQEFLASTSHLCYAPNRHDMLKSKVSATWRAFSISVSKTQPILRVGRRTQTHSEMQSLQVTGWQRPSFL